MTGTPSEKPPATGVGAFRRFAMFTFATVVFVTVGLVTVIRGGPLTVVTAYVLLAAGSAFLAAKVFPRKRTIMVVDPSRRSARRSGNPAARTNVERSKDSD